MINATPSSEKYPLSMRVYHWLVGLLIILMLIFGLLLDSIPEDFRRSAMGLHKSIGAALLFLVVFRMINRISLELKKRVPDLPDNFNKSEKLMAKLVHLAFYGLIFAMPLSGYLLSNAADRPVVMFGIPMPNLISPDQGMREFFGDAHEIIAYILILFIGLHILALFKHIKYDGVNLLNRMK